MPTQIQVRGAVTATQEARTLASRELDIDTTLKRVNIHDGSTTGGIPHANYVDVQNSRFIYASAVGTNALTLTLAKAPTAYASGQAFKFKAQNTNTGSVTLNVNGLGAKTIKKPDGATGTLVTLDASDIIQNAIYTANYNGTDFVLEAVGGSGILTLVQSEEITSSTSEIEFLNVFATGYRYFLEYSDVTVDGTLGTDQVYNLQFSSDGGSNYFSESDYDYNVVSSTSSGGVINSLVSDTELLIFSLGRPATDIGWGSISFNEIANPSYQISGVIQGSKNAPLGGNIRSEYRSGNYIIGDNSFKSANSFKIFSTNSGSPTIESGTFSLYQIKA